jgi:hypothetical protein
MIPSDRAEEFFLIRNSGGGAHDGAMSFEYVRAYMNDALWIDHDLKTEQ